MLRATVHTYSLNLANVQISWRFLTGVLKIDRTLILNFSLSKNRDRYFTTVDKRPRKGPFRCSVLTLGLREKPKARISVTKQN